MICRRRVGSERTVPMSGGHSTTSRLPFFAASGSASPTTSPTSDASSDRLVVDLELPRLDLRQVENLVDQLQQMLAGTRDPLQRLARAPVARILGILHEHFGDANDGVQWRAQFMAHIGEEPALGDRRLHRRVARLGQPVDELPKLQLAILKLGDVGEHADDSPIRSPPLADLEPHAAAALLFEGTLGIAVAIEPLGDPARRACPKPRG